MMIDHLFKYFKFDISSETAFAPSLNIGHTLLRMMQAGTRERAHIPQGPRHPQFDFGSSYSSIQALMDKMNSLELSSSSSSEKIQLPSEIYE